jgi:DNA mismatch repair protein MutS
VLDDLPLFAHQPPPPKAAVNPIHDMLDKVRPDDLTPRQAIDLIYELKKIRDAARRT